MKKTLSLLMAILGMNGFAVAQMALTVPYIPVKEAAPLDLSETRRQLADQSYANATQLYSELTKRYQELVLNADMLPLRKKRFYDGTNAIINQQTADMNAHPYSFVTEQAIGSVKFKESMLALFDATLLQSYKEEYRRVKEWEMYLRDKNLLDAPYKNGAQPSGLTNREAISALFGVDQVLFDKVDWK
jgi:hypothetical protein